ncbi:MAG: hypothetical protein IJ302_03200, partial [Clostridia bacterium]|nr:hypothetical protein [Clostridia bacterium]
RHFGNTVPLIFNDEAAIPRYAYTPGMDAAFADAFGYDLYEYLPYIREILPCETEAQKCAHRDYRLFLGMLIRERYFLPIRDWCRAHGICSAGHLNHDHTTRNLVGEASYGAPLETLRCFDIPGVDVIWRQMWPETDAGMDPVLPFYPRYASSAAHQIGAAAVLAECLAVYGDGVTHDHIRWLCGQLAARGVNSFNFFGLSYGKQDCDLILERPVYDPVKPGFSAMARVNRVMERLACMMQAGTPAVSCALYLPQNDILRGGDGMQAAIAAFDRLGLQLEADHIDFDIVDDAWIRGAQIQDGILCAGDVRYTAVIVPECTDIPADVREKLDAVSAEVPQPNLYCEEGAPLLARARQLADGMLTLVVNTEMTPYAGRIGLPAAGRYCFEMDMNTGEYFRCQTVEEDSIRFFDAEIPGGGEFVLLQTDDASLLCGAAEALCPAGKPITLTAFTAAVTEECRLTQEGVLRTQYKEPEWRDMTVGAWESAFGADFSGTVTYRCTVVPEETLPGDVQYVLSLGAVENTAEVRVNGSLVGMIGFSWDTVMFNVPQEPFALEIAVSNSFANQCAAVDAHTMWDSATVGVYHDRTVRFERDCAGGGLLGPVVLTPVKRTENHPETKGENLS